MVGAVTRAGGWSVERTLRRTLQPAHARALCPGLRGLIVRGGAGLIPIDDILIDLKGLDGFEVIIEYVEV